MTLPRTLRLRAALTAGLLGVALVVAACGSSSSSSSTPTASASNAAASATNAPVSGIKISTAKGSGGVYLAGASGRALYLWVADTGGMSSCSGACAKVWPPLLAKTTPAVAGGVNASDIGTITRSNGTKQVTYKGHPLYYFEGDRSAGSTTGQGSDSFGAKWWLVAPSGSAIISHGSAQTVGSSSSSSSSSGGGGGWG
jgi:predicted lipoprotein with Yx(FWY)xxD motif